MSEIGRLAGVFFEPGKVFADLAAKPRWLVPILISILLGLCFVYALNSRVGWDQTIRQAMTNNPRTADLTPAQKEQAIQRGAQVAAIVAWIGAILGPPVFVLVIAGVLTGLFNALLGTDLRFGQMFSITAYAMLVRGLYTVLIVLILYLKPPEDFDIRFNPFSIGGYLNRTDTPKWLMSLATSFDLFSIWSIVLLAIGFSVASKKLSFGKCLTAIAIPWLVVVVALMGLQSFQ
ncbi:MAG TPA: YIP1 family protein [Bryobacteraceae bacterium]|nr:YIP1 family protein [Bryobacteraceae bacterium]